MKIFVGRDAGIGDILLCNQVVRAVKERYNDAIITFGCGPDPIPALLDTNPTIDTVISFPHNDHPKPALRRSEMRIREYARKHNDAYDKIILLFPEDDFFDYCIRNKMHLIEYFAECADVTLLEKKAMLFFTSTDVALAGLLMDKYGIQEGYIAINHRTFYTSGQKQWDLNNFQLLVNRLHEISSKQVVVFGSAEDASLDNCINVRGEFIRAVALMLEKASLYIGLDSGITHMASCFNLPIIAIHPSSLPEISGALAEDITFIRGATIDNEKYCVTFESVWQAIEKNLINTLGY